VAVKNERVYQTVCRVGASTSTLAGLWKRYCAFSRVLLAATTVHENTYIDASCPQALTRHADDYGMFSGGGHLCRRGSHPPKRTAI
jgi:hypothetical protein